MSPKTKYSREEIIDVAFDIAKNKGLTEISARKVAKELKSSVAPIYVNFATIDDLLSAVVNRVFSLSEEMLFNQEGGSFFERIGKASIKFAKEYPILFRELSVYPNPYMQSYESIEERMILALKDDQELQGWSVKERKSLLLKMRAFHIGLSVMVANDQIPSWLKEEDLEELLFEVGKDFIRAKKLKT